MVVASGDLAGVFVQALSAMAKQGEHGASQLRAAATESHSNLQLHEVLFAALSIPAQVFSSQALSAMAKERGDGTVVCPVTKAVFALATARPVYIL